MSESPKHAEKSLRSYTIATAGHVDHGKSSLVKCLTGTETDTLAEEKSRGLTINLGFAYAHIPDPTDSGIETILGFVDVPGHQDFIANMLAGVESVQGALLVVAADDGIMPQTLEHLAILKLLGLRRIVIAISKADRVEQDRIEELRQELQQLLVQHMLESVPMLEVSSVTGAGIDRLRRALLELSSKAELEKQLARQRRLRYLIDRSFSLKGIGTVVTGTVIGGAVTTGMSPQHSATGESARVRSIRLDSIEMDSAQAPQRAALNISLAHDVAHRGDWLIDPEYTTAIDRFDALLDCLVAEPGFRSGALYHLHIGAGDYIVTIRSLGDGESRLYQLKSQVPLFIHAGDRFIIRDPAARETLAGGRVLDIHVPRRGRGSESRLRTLKTLSKEPAAALAELLKNSDTGVSLHRFASNLNLSPSGIDVLLEELRQSDVSSISLEAGETLPQLIASRHCANWQQAICQQVESFHRTNPHKQGIAEPQLSAELNWPGTHAVLQALLNRLITSGELVRTGTSLHTPAHRAQLSPTEKKFLESIRPLLQQAGRVPPRTRELVDATGIPLPTLEAILKETTRSGNLVKVAHNRHYLPETILELAEFTERLARQSDADQGFSVIEFRDASGIGRNLCIEILEYFDGIGFTRRDDNTRFVRTDMQSVFGARDSGG